MSLLITSDGRSVSVSYADNGSRLHSAQITETQMRGYKRPTSSVRFLTGSPRARVGTLPDTGKALPRIQHRAKRLLKPSLS